MEQLYKTKDTSFVLFNEEKQGDFAPDPRDIFENKEMIHRIIVWFRNDLRVHDNYILKTAMNTVERSNLKNKAGGAKVTTEILPVFCFDPRFYDAMTPFGTKKCGFNRTRFMLESVANLRKNLQAVGSDLIVSHEPVETFIPKLVPKLQKDLAPGDVREVTSLLY